MKRILTIFLSILIITTVISPTEEVQAANNTLDMVFIIDRSGSMGDDIKNVKNNIDTFADKLEAQGIAYRLGIVSYEKSTTIYPMTSDVNQFKNNLSRINVSGGTENGLDAIMNAINNYTYDYRAVKYFVLIGDEKVCSRNGYSNQDVINALKENNIILTTVGIGGVVQTQFSNLATQTNGMFLNLNTSFGTNLQTIFEQIQSIPAMNVNFPENNQYYNKSNQFIPSITVSDEDSDVLTCSYSIDDKTKIIETKQATNTITSQKVAFSAVDISTLAEGWHTFYFTVNDGTESIETPVKVYIDYNPPVISSANYSVTDYDIKVNIDASDAASGLATEPYEYLINGVGNQWVALNNNTFNGLQPNTSYKIDVKVKDNVDNITTQTKDIVTNAMIPELNIKNKTENSITIKTTDNNPSNTEYEIKCGDQYVNSSGNVVSTPQWITLNSKEITLQNLPKNTSYLVQAKARNLNKKETACSNSISATTLAPVPSNIVLTPSQNDIYISFDPIQGVAGYEIEIDSAQTVQVSTPYYDNTNLQADTLHTYRVRSINQGGAGNYSAPVSISTLPYIPDTPTNIISTPSQESMTITWDQSIRADFYELEIDENLINVGNKTTYTLNDLQPETKHQFRVRAVSRGGTSEFTELIEETTLPYPPEKITDVTVEKTNTSITLSFNPVDKADSYEMEVDGMIIDIGNNTSYTHSGLDALSFHNYKVRGVNRGGKGEWSEEQKIMTYPNAPSIPANIFGTSSENEISILFNSVENASQYEIEVDGNNIIEITETSFEHTDLQPGTEHSYRVRAVNITGKSDWSTPFTSSTLEQLPEGQEPIALTNIGAIVTNHTITISWEAVAVDADYSVEVDGKTVDIGKNKIYYNTDLEANSFHKYRIIATKEGQEPVFCGSLTLSTLPNPPDAPDGLKATAGEHYIQLNWTKVEGADTYEIEIDGTIVNVGNSSLYSDDDLTSGTSHSYRIRAVNISGTTAWSEPITISTTNPEYEVSFIKDQYIDVSVVATNVQDFTGFKYVITYDKDVLEVVDLSKFTSELEQSDTSIKDADISIHYEEGKIEIEVNKSIVPGTSFDGEINTITFKALKDTSTSINLSETN